MSFIDIVAVIGIVAWVIGRQLAGESLRAKRVILLPVILIVIGGLDLHSSTIHARPADVACLVVGGLVVVAIGVAQGSVLRLTSKDGYLWGQLPPRGLLLWLLLIISRVVTTVVADGLDAKLAAASSTILLMLGVNRLAQAAVVVPRALAAGIPFAPEKDGKQFLPALTSPAGRGTAPSTRVTPSTRVSPARPASRVATRRSNRHDRHDCHRHDR